MTAICCPPELNRDTVKKKAKFDTLYFELNDNENTTHKNPWDSAKTVHRSKFIALNAYVRKE